eukprot:gene15388-4560_t
MPKSIFGLIGTAPHLFQCSRMPTRVSSPVERTCNAMAASTRSVNPNVLPVHSTSLYVRSPAKHLFERAKASTNCCAQLSGGRKSHAFSVAQLMMLCIGAVDP